jgi:long-chain acyl-CoA synthetase
VGSELLTGDAGVVTAEAGTATAEAGAATAEAGRTLARLARQVELGAAEVDLSLSQYRVLSILDSGQEAASSLAEKLAVSRPSITGVVDGLVARGLVRRDTVDADRRRVDVGLTGEGAAVLAAADAEIQLRLEGVAAFMAPGSGDPFAGFAPWQAALNAYRQAKRAEEHDGRR